MDNRAKNNEKISSKITITGSFLIVILILSLVACVFAAVYLCHIGNLDEVYTDIISEWTSRIGSNRSGEMRLLWMLVFGGAPMCAAGQLLVSRHAKEGLSGSGKGNALDEGYRHAVTKMSYLHFTSTEEYRRRVIQLGESPDRVFNVGAWSGKRAYLAPAFSL